MVDDVVYLVGIEFMKHWNSNSSVCQSSEESHCPMSAVTSADSYLVTSFHTAVLEENMQLFNLSGYVVKL